MNRTIKKLYKTIKDANDQIKKIQEKCQHKKTYVGKYSWRIGTYDDANICDNCDSFVSYVNQNTYEVGVTTTSDNDNDDFMVIDMSNQDK